MPRLPDPVRISNDMMFLSIGFGYPPVYLLRTAQPSGQRNSGFVPVEIDRRGWHGCELGTSFTPCFKAQITPKMPNCK
jgi:hypothetical protein